MGIKYVSKKEEKESILLLLFLISIYVLENTETCTFMKKNIYIYKIKPILFVTIVILSIIYGVKVRISRKRRHEKLVRFIGFINGIMYILFFIVAGFFSGFGQSPYDTSLYGIYTNIIHIIGIGIGLEFIRSFLVNNTFNKSPVVAIVSISLLYTLIGTSIGEIISMKSGLDIVNHLGEEFLPELGKNLVASYLVYLGGFLPALLYMTTISMFYNICPVLPDLSWIIKTFLGTIVPFMNLSLINYIYEDEVREIKVNKDEEEGIFGWIITSIGSILIIWFAAGLFTIYPSVIATGSMEPLIYPGDMIILEKIGEEESLVNGDIIQFKRDDILITHRIIDIIEIEESKEIEYVTKGDNNSAKDFETVKKCQIKGKLLRTIPKVGLFTLLLKADKDVDLKSIEF